MKEKLLALFVFAIFSFPLVAQTTHPHTGGFKDRVTINNKKFHVIYEEVAIDKTVDEVWGEVSGNFMHIAEITEGINFTRNLSGDITSGLGAERLCNLDIQGKTMEIKERIIDFKGTGDHREFTYDVYESTKGFVKTYGTWIVKKGSDGRTYLASAFIFRAKFSPMTGLVEKKLRKIGLRTGILSYKHYLETGEKKVAPEKLVKLYPN
ncbi:MAG: hypothetical protein AB8F78_14505 [Saprospiraceae bacterium]